MRNAVLLAFVGLACGPTGSPELTTQWRAQGSATAECGVWTLTGSMATRRHAHAMARLLDGRVLVAGGADDGNVLASSELYDPATGLWTPAASMGTARYQPAGSLLPDGKVLVSSDGTAELYDPATNSWSVTGNLPTSRFQETTTVLTSGNVLSVGGYLGNVVVANAEEYDPGTGVWHSVEPMTAPRTSHAATLLQSGKVLVTGGFVYSDVEPTSSTEIFDPVINLWSQAASMSRVRTRHGAALLLDGRALVTGGRSGGEYTATTEVYDPASNTWSPVGSMSVIRGEFFEVNRLKSGTVLVSGGWAPDQPIAAAELFDPATGTWAPTGAMSTPRQDAASVVLQDGRGLVAGGLTTQRAILSSAEIYTPCDTPGDENEPPVAVCVDQVVPAGPTCSATANIDNGSYDPDSGPAPLVLTQDPAGPYGLGDHLVTLTASDGAATASCQATVIVVDDTPPVAGASKGLVLWPPNHRFRRVSISGCAQDATDNCASTLSLEDHAQITSVTSDEPDDGDIVLVGPTAVDLRAERDGASDGRAYTIYYTVTDLSGSSTAASCTVSVPHDQSAQ